MTNGSGLCPWHWFPADRQLPNFAAGFGVQVRLKEMELRRPGNGEPVGWLAIFTSSWGWMSSGAGICPTAGRELAGRIFCKPWFAIDSLIREANGGYIGSGLNKERWEICWMKNIRWRASARWLAPMNHKICA